MREAMSTDRATAGDLANRLSADLMQPMGGVGGGRCNIVVYTKERWSSSTWSRWDWQYKKYLVEKKKNPCTYALFEK